MPSRKSDHPYEGYVKFGKNFDTGSSLFRLCQQRNEEKRTTTHQLKAPRSRNMRVSNTVNIFVTLAILYMAALSTVPFFWGSVSLAFRVPYPRSKTVPAGVTTAIERLSISDLEVRSERKESKEVDAAMICGLSR